MASANSNYNVDCFSSIKDKETITTVIALLGVVIGVLLLVIIIPCAKAYKSFLQRLVVFMVLSMLIEDCCRAVGQFFNNSNSNSLNQACEFLGFITLTFHWSNYMLILVWLLYLFAMVCMHTTQGSVIVKLKNTKLVVRVLLEVSIISCAVIGPAVLVLWIPFLDDQSEYGFNEYDYICTIRPSLTDHNSSTIVKLRRMLFTYVPVVLTGLTGILLTAGVVIGYCTLTNKHVKTSMKNLFAFALVSFGSILAYVLMSVAQKNLPCSNILYSMKVVIATFGKSALIIIYLVIFHGMKRRGIDRNDAQNIMAEYGTFPASSRVTPPSNTYFSIEHTGDFDSSS